MEYRQGVCSGCQNSFRVPATFVQNRAKCPKCGGVVDIGPVQGGAAAGATPATPAATSAPVTHAAPAAAPVAAPTAVPARVPPPTVAPASVPAKAPAPKPAAAAPTRPAPAPVAKPAPAVAQAGPAAASSVTARPAATKPGAASPAAAKPGAATAKPAPAKPSVRATAEAAAAKVKSGAAKAHREDDHEESGKKRRAGGHARPKKSMAPVLLSVGVLVALGAAGGWYFLVKKPADAEAARASEQAAAEAKRAALLGQGSSVAAAEKSETPDEAPPVIQAESEPTAVPEKPAPKASKKADLVDDINLLDLPVLEKYSASSDEEWQEIVELAKTFVDLSAGARGNRAGLKLEEIGRGAFPALLNELRVLNLNDPDDFRRGDMIQKRLEKICNGRNYGWKYDGDLESLVYNKKAVKNWFSTWEKAGEDDAQWAGLTKQDAKAAAPGDEDKPAGGALDDF